MGLDEVKVTVWLPYVRAQTGAVLMIGGVWTGWGCSRGRTDMPLQCPCLLPSAEDSYKRCHEAHETGEARGPLQTRGQGALRGADISGDMINSKRNHLPAVGKPRA